MKRLFLLLCTLAALSLAAMPDAGARKTPKVQRRPEPQLGGPTPVTPGTRPADGFRLSREKGWIEGHVVRDSGAAQLVTLFVPDLTQPGGTRPVSEYLDAEGNFRFAADLYGPTTLGMKYDGGWLSLFLYPDDTLRLSFRSADFGEGNDGKFGSLIFGAGRSGVASRHRMGFERLKQETPAPEFAPATDLASWIAFLRGRDSADRATLTRYVAAENPPAEVADMLCRTIRNTYAGYTWQGYLSGNGPVAPEQVRELHRTVGFPVTDDRDFADPAGHCYVLYQTAQSYTFSDTSSVRSAREKMACALDSILLEYPPSLSRDVLCLHAFLWVSGKPELYAKIYPLRGRYIASPLVRDLVPAPPTEAPAAEASAKASPKGERNFYNLPLKEAERFIGDIFAPYKGSGKVLYVDVWGVWCGPCRAEMPNSVKLHGELTGEPVEFIYICIDSKQKDWTRSKADLKIEGSGKHILLTADQSNILKNYMGFSGVPTYWIIDREGRLRGASRPSDTATKSLLLKLAGGVERCGSPAGRMMLRIA